MFCITHVDHLNVATSDLLAVLAVEDRPPVITSSSKHVVERKAGDAPVFVKLDSGDHHIAWVDADGC